MSLADPGRPVTKEPYFYEVYCLKAKRSRFFLIFKKILTVPYLHLANVLNNVQVF